MTELTQRIISAKSREQKGAKSPIVDSLILIMAAAFSDDNLVLRQAIGAVMRDIFRPPAHAFAPYFLKTDRVTYANVNELVGEDLVPFIGAAIELDDNKALAAAGAVDALALKAAVAERCSDFERVIFSSFDSLEPPSRATQTAFQSMKVMLQSLTGLVTLLSRLNDAIRFVEMGEGMEQLARKLQYKGAEAMVKSVDIGRDEDIDPGINKMLESSKRGATNAHKKTSDVAERHLV